MAVKIGSARIDERGKANGGRAGDQTDGEVSTQNWYKHSKGWRVIRPKDSKAAEKIAVAMERACANNRIGYDQYQRNTLYDNVKAYGFDPSKTTKNVETDCSALVRVCCAYAGIMVGNFNTSSEATVLLATGKFVELKDSKYQDKPDYLHRGDILVTKTKGHTVVVLSNGGKNDDSEEERKTVSVELSVLRKGSKGYEVKTLQRMLMALGYKLPRYKDDGDFGGETLEAVKAFQKDKRLEVDGICGKATWGKLLKNE